MSANDQLSFIAGLTGAPEVVMGEEEGERGNELYNDLEYSMVRKSGSCYPKVVCPEWMQ